MIGHQGWCYRGIARGMLRLHQINHYTELAVFKIAMFQAYLV